MRSRHAEVRCRAGRRLVRELGDEEPEGDDRHDPRQDHGDPLARLDTGLEGAKNKLEEEERDERRRRLRSGTHHLFCLNEFVITARRGSVATATCNC